MPAAKSSPPVQSKEAGGGGIFVREPEDKEKGISRMQDAAVNDRGNALC